MLHYMSCTLRTENIFEIRLYYTSQKPLDRPSRVFILNEMRFHHRSREFLSSLSLPFPFIYLISLLLASLMRYTIVFYIKSFLPCGLSPATRSLTGQLPSPPFVPFFSTQWRIPNLWFNELWKCCCKEIAAVRSRRFSEDDFFDWNVLTMISLYLTFFSIIWSIIMIIENIFNNLIC